MSLRYNRVPLIFYRRRTRVAGRSAIAVTMSITAPAPSDAGREIITHQNFSIDHNRNFFCMFEPITFGSGNRGWSY